jgi:hypothetical protein
MDTVKIFGDIPEDADYVAPKLSISEQLKSLYKDRPTLMSKILSMYKFIFSPEEKQIWEKTANDISDDIANAKYNLDLDRVVKETYAAIENAEQTDALFNRKTTMIAPLLDFCYIYYVTHYDDTAPLYKLPTNKFKFDLITKVLHADDEKSKKLFSGIINSDLFASLRKEDMPFYLCTEMSIEEQRKAFEKIVKPTMKDLINSLLLLGRSHTESTPDSKLSVDLL